MHIFFSVGEPSGDLHAAKLIRELQRRSPGLVCAGLGGPLMQQAGCQLLFRLTDLAVMGFLRVVPLLWKFWQVRKQARQYLRDHRPDAVVLIDFPGFNWWIARDAKKLGIPVLYYLPPQLWAWAGWRIRRMKKWVDHVFSGLSFETEWLKARGMSVEFVGHPFFDDVAERSLTVDLRQPARPTVAVLPGSRDHEVAHNFPLQLQVMHQLRKCVPGVRFLVACYKESQRKMCRDMLRAERMTQVAACGKDAVETQLRLPHLELQSMLPQDVELHVQRTSEIIAGSDVGLAVSGSVSLELLARTLPTVVVYQVSRSIYCVGKLLIKCRYMSLPNLMVNRPLMPEFCPVGKNIQPAVQGITTILRDWLKNVDSRQQVILDLAQLRDQVAQPGATARTAEALLNWLQQGGTIPATSRAGAAVGDATGRHEQGAVPLEETSSRTAA